MREIRTILVPTDFSSHSGEAIGFATGLAKSLGASIHLLHAYSIPVQALTPYDFSIPSSGWEGIRAAAGQKLDQLREKVAAEGLEVSVHLSQALPTEAITSAAEELRADLIVMGTRGNTGLKHVLLGSVAERAIRLAPCPVLTVKHALD